MSPGPQVSCAQCQLRRCPSRVCAHRRRKRCILDEVAHLDFIVRARPSASRTAQTALVVEYLGVRDERDLVGRQPADVAAAAIDVQGVAQGHRGSAKLRQHRLQAQRLPVRKSRDVEFFRSPERRLANSPKDDAAVFMNLWNQKLMRPTIIAIAAASDNFHRRRKNHSGARPARTAFRSRATSDRRPAAVSA